MLLQGIQVLDLADEKASFCSKMLADLGARVIKLERPGGDPARQSGPLGKNTPQPAESLSFCYHNTNKLGITLDLTSQAGPDLFRRLAAGSDVVVESFAPGHLDGLGLGYSVLSEVNPQLILLSITGFGQKGPRRDFRACDLIAAAFGGQMCLSGHPSSPPLKLPGKQSYMTASLYGAVGILLALRKRDRTGKGDHIDIALQEAVLSTLEPVLIQYFHNHIIPRRQGRMHWNHVFHILPCKDGSIQLTLFQQWETLVEWMASEGMAADLDDVRWRDADYRLRHRDYVLDVLGRWTRTHTTGELFELGQLMGFPWAPVQTPQQIGRCPQHTARGFFVDVAYPEQSAAMKYPRLPFRFANTALRYKRAPRVGEDNQLIYQDQLGLSKSELKALQAQNII